MEEKIFIVMLEKLDSISISRTLLLVVSLSVSFVYRLKTRRMYIH